MRRQTRPGTLLQTTTDRRFREQSECFHWPEEKARLIDKGIFEL